MYSTAYLENHNLLLPSINTVAKIGSLHKSTAYPVSLRSEKETIQFLPRS